MFFRFFLSGLFNKPTCSRHDWLQICPNPPQKYADQKIRPMGSIERPGAGPVNSPVSNLVFYVFPEPYLPDQLVRNILFIA
ncbi:MAG: hypothetical protein WBM02_10615 [bacterium]